MFLYIVHRYIEHNSQKDRSQRVNRITHRTHETIIFVYLFVPLLVFDFDNSLFIYLPIFNDTDNVYPYHGSAL